MIRGHTEWSIRQFGSQRVVGALLLGTFEPDAALARRENRPLPSSPAFGGAEGGGGSELGRILADVRIDVSFEQVALFVLGEHQARQHRAGIEVDVPDFSRRRVPDEVMTRPVDARGLFQALVLKAGTVRRCRRRRSSFDFCRFARIVSKPASAIVCRLFFITSGLSTAIFIEGTTTAAAGWWT